VSNGTNLFDCLGKSKGGFSVQGGAETDDAAPQKPGEASRLAAATAAAEALKTKCFKQERKRMRRYMNPTKLLLCFPFFLPFFPLFVCVSVCVCVCLSLLFFLTFPFFLFPSFSYIPFALLCSPFNPLFLVNLFHCSNDNWSSAFISHITSI
jgi:hypothetical protein